MSGCQNIEIFGKGRQIKLHPLALLEYPDGVSQGFPSRQLIAIYRYFNVLCCAEKARENSKKATAALSEIRFTISGLRCWCYCCAIELSLTILIAKFAPQKLARIIFNAAKPLFERLLLLEFFIGRFRRVFCSLLDSEPSCSSGG